MPRNHPHNLLKFFIVPGDTFLFEIQEATIPDEGMLIDYLDAETQVTTRYRVQDVIYEVEEFAIVPPQPPGNPGSPLNHGIVTYRIEIVVVP